MDKNDISLPMSILDSLRTANLQLTLHGKPFVQSQDDRWSINNIIYNDYDLFYCSGGSALFTIDNQEFELKPGRVLLCFPEKKISARKTSSKNFEAIAQHFTLQVSGGGDFFRFIKLNQLVSLTHPQIVYEDYLRYSQLQDVPRSNVLRQSLFLSVLFSYIQDGYAGEITQEDRSIRLVFDIATRIESSLARNDALDYACNTIPLSRDYVVRLFKKHFGIPPKEYLQQCRMNAARNSLTRGSTVKETAYVCGFSDELYFSRFFHQREGMSPKQYQLLHRNR